MPTDPPTPARAGTPPTPTHCATCGHHVQYHDSLGCQLWACICRDAYIPAPVAPAGEPGTIVRYCEFCPHPPHAQRGHCGVNAYDAEGRIVWCQCVIARPAPSPADVTISRGGSGGCGGAGWEPSPAASAPCTHSPRPLQDGSWTCDWCAKDMTGEMRIRGASGADSDALMTLRREAHGDLATDPRQPDVPATTRASTATVPNAREGFPASVSDDPDGTRRSRCNSDLAPFRAPEGEPQAVIERAREYAWQQRALAAESRLAESEHRAEDAEKAFETRCRLLRAREERLRQSEAARGRLAELLRMERELLRDDVLFYGTHHEPEFNADHRCADCWPVRVALLNDTFGYACADCEEVSDEELPIVYDAHKRWGHHGVTAWASLKRGGEPLDPLRTVEFREARAALAAEAAGREKGEK